jgi:hypothetical protein
LAIAPVGLAAELLASGGRMDDFTGLVADGAEARVHILHLQAYVFGSGREEGAQLEECMDIAWRLQAREAARSAVAEAIGDGKQRRRTTMRIVHSSAPVHCGSKVSN